MSVETRIKVEQLARRKHSRPLKFMKSQVGFSAGDTADVVSETNGGIRFLCFAAILLSGGKADLDSAELLESFLSRRSSTDRPSTEPASTASFVEGNKAKTSGCGVSKVFLGWCIWCMAK